jgi:hypothetical protein
VTYLAAALFFTLAFLAAAVVLHMTVRAYWSDIMLALKGELGRAPMPAAPVRAQPVRVFARQQPQQWRVAA